MDRVESWSDIGLRIREAREARGLSQGDLGSRIGMDRTAVVRMEGGDRKVSAMELFSLAEVLDTPVGHFLSRPPQAVVSRRRTAEAPADAATRSGFRLDVRLEDHARNAQWLVEHGFLSPPAIGTPALQKIADPVAVAREARATAGLPEGPVGPLADVLEKFGLYLTVVPEKAEGASLLQDGYGVAAISATAKPGRRRWTAVHELGHHLLQDEYHSDAGVAAGRDEREQSIDRFAEEFLLPEPDIRRVWERREADGLDEHAALITIAAAFRVSWSAVINRARKLHLVSSADAPRLKARTPVRGDFLRICGEEPREDLLAGATGRTWRKAVMAAWQGQVITSARTVELLYGLVEERDLPPHDQEDDLP